MTASVMDERLWQIVSEALKSAQAVGAEHLTAGKYVAGQDVPEWKVNSAGWPSCVASERLSRSGESPADWKKMFGSGNSASAIPLAECPSLEAICSRLVELALSDSAVEHAVSLISSVFKDDVEKRKDQIQHEFLHVLGVLLNRAYALNATSDDALLGIYRQWEAGQFLSEFRVTSWFPSSWALCQIARM